jgi:LuxR family maltose regulon positive regulatory protein
LWKRLDESSRLALTLVSAPAGYGKSVLVAGWLPEAGRPCGWLSLDEQDSDPILFLPYVLAAIESALPGQALALSAALDIAAPPPVEELAALLINDLEELQEDLVLVLDDYQAIREPGVHDILASVLRRPPPRLHLILLTRADPPLPLAALTAAGLMDSIRFEELRFTEAEATSFLSETVESEIDPAVAAHLTKATEGWAVGLRLAAVGLSRSDDPAAYLAAPRASAAQMTGFLMAEVLSALTAGELQTLLVAAIPARFCASQCEALLGELDSALTGQGFLEWLLGSGLFVSSLDEHEEWYRFHPLFRELLLHEHERRLGSESISRLRLRAGEWLEERDHLGEAFELYLVAGAPERAAGLLRRHRHTLMDLAQWSHLDRLLKRLPSELVSKDVELLLARAWISESRSQYSLVLGTLKKVEALIAEPAEPPQAELRAEIDALSTVRPYLAGDAPGAVALGRQALAALPETSRSVRGYAIALLAMSLQQTGELGLARATALEELAALSRRGTALHARILISLCFVHSMAGETESVMRFARELIALGEEQGLAEATSFGRYHLGVAHWDRNEIEEVESALEPVAQERFHPNVVNYVLSMHLMALSLDRRGRSEEALAVHDALVAYSLELCNPELVELCEALGAELALRQGRGRTALPWARRHSPEVPGPWWRFFAPELTWIRVMENEGEESERRQAAELLEQLEANLRSQHQHCLLVDVLALQALRQARAGDEDAATSILREAMALAAPQERVRPFLGLGSEMTSLMERLRLRATADGFEEIVALPAAPQRPPPAQLDELSHRELDVLELLAERLSNKEIGARLHISSATVKRHTVNIYQKLHVHRRREAVAKAFNMGILGSA